MECKIWEMTKNIHKSSTTKSEFDSFMIYERSTISYHYFIISLLETKKIQKLTVPVNTLSVTFSLVNLFPVKVKV